MIFAGRHGRMVGDTNGRPISRAQNPSPGCSIFSICAVKTSLCGERSRGRVADTDESCEPRMTKTTHTALVPIEQITQSIVIVRGQRVLLDSQIAALYGVTTKALNQATKRNAERFPADFMFRLIRAEVEALNRSQTATASGGTQADALNRSQTVTGSQKHRDPRFPPFAFTEHGAIMAATILNSPRAVEMSLYVVRAFVKLRELLASNHELARRLDELEARITQQFASHDQAITGILRTIRELMNPPVPKRRGIGFTANFDDI